MCALALHHQPTYSTFKVALVLPIATQVIGINEASLDTHHMFPPLLWVVQKLPQVVKELFESHLC